MPVSDWATWARQMAFLTTARPGLRVRTVLSSMSVEHLVATGGFNGKMYSLVREYLDHIDTWGMDEDVMSDGSQSDADNSQLEEDDDVEGSEAEYSSHASSTGTVDQDLTETMETTHTEPLSGFSNLPPEIGLQIIRDVQLADRLQLGQVSRNSEFLVGEALRDAAVSILRRYKLTLGEVRLLQAALGCIISGSTVPALIHARTFTPGDLDFYTPSGSGFMLVRYLKATGIYRVTKRSTPYNYAAGIGKVWTVVMIGSPKVKINVIESLSANPFDAIGHFHATCVFGAWTALGIWHAYPFLTLQGVAIVTPGSLPVTDDLSSHQHVWKILQKYKQRGFTFWLGEYRRVHECGVDFNCPSTPRATNDAGCLFMPFPRGHFDPECRPIPWESTWTMKGAGCKQGFLSKAGTLMKACTNFADLVWEDLVKEFLRSPAKPLDVL